MSNRSDAWTSDQAYEPYVGRWSRLVAPRFLQWLPPASPLATWCDVGCGTGALAHSILTSEQPARVLGVDPSLAYLAAAKHGAGDLPIDAVMGSATAIPARTGEFDRVVSALVLNFMPQPHAALQEMRRVTRPGGVVGGYVWDYAEGMQLIRAFWDAACALDPAAVELDEGRRFTLCRPQPLRLLFDAHTHHQSQQALQRRRQGRIRDQLLGECGEARGQQRTVLGRASSRRLRHRGPRPTTRNPELR